MRQQTKGSRRNSRSRKGNIALGVVGLDGQPRNPRNVDERLINILPDGRVVYSNLQHLPMIPPEDDKTGGFENTGIIVLFALLLAILVDLAFGSPFLKSIGVTKGSFAAISPFVSSISSNAVLPPF